MEKEKLEQKIEKDITNINTQLSKLEEERDELIKLKFQLEREEQQEESSSWAKRVSEARAKTRKVYEGRRDAKLGKLNFFKRKRKERREDLENGKNS